MIEVKLAGGLGNQLFQYAYAKKLQKHTERENKPEPIFLNGTWLHLRDPLRDVELQNFNLCRTSCVLSSLFGGGHNLLQLLRFARVFWNLVLKNKFFHKTKHHTEDDFERGCANGIIRLNNPYSCRLPKCSLPSFKYCSGFFQSYKTVEGMEDELRRDLTVKAEVPLSPENGRLLADINSTQSVCVHIRRGDYLLPQYAVYNVCTEDYYRRAIQDAALRIPDAVFYVFSGSQTDIDYIRDNYNLGQNVRYVDLGNDTIGDFRLMMACKHFIISNSTYSWWTAFLGSYAAKKVWAPSLWRKDQPHAADELYASSWTRIIV